MCLCALLVMCDVMVCVCVGVSVFVPVAFLLFKVCVCLVCDWLRVVEWLGCVCAFFLMCVVVCGLFFCYVCAFRV